MATLIATDDSIVAFGDGAHAIPINPNIVENIGETSTVFGLSITLDNVGLIKPAENVHGEWEYWFVEFTVKSTLDEIQYVNPGVEAQLQYLSGNHYIWDLHDFEQSQCDNENLVNGLNPRESFHCRYIYIVPADERNLYWVYARDGKVDGSYEERYVVFQIR